MNKHRCKIVTATLIILVTISTFVLFYSSRDESSSIGTLKWEFDAENKIVSPPLPQSPYIFLQTKNSILALELSTGKVVWDIPAQYSSGEIDRNFLGLKDNSLIVSRESNSIFVVSANTGKLIWGKKLNKDVLDMEIYENTLYEAQYSAFLTSYDLFSGDVKWTANLPSRTSVYIFPDSDIVYLGTNSSLFAYSSSNGQMVWHYDFGGLVGNMVKNGNVLYVGFVKEERCTFEALNLESLESIWCLSREDAAPFLEISDMLVENNSLFVSGSRLMALSTASGKIVWNIEKNNYFSGLNIYKNQIYVQSRTEIYKFNKIDGKGSSVFSYPSTYILSWMSYSSINPVVYEGYIFITNNKKLYAYQLSD